MHFRLVVVELPKKNFWNILERKKPCCFEMSCACYARHVYTSKIVAQVETVYQEKYDELNET